MKLSRQAGEPRRQISSPVHAQGAAATLREDLEVSPGLRCFDHAEGAKRLAATSDILVAGAPIFQVGLYRRGPAVSL